MTRNVITSYAAAAKSLAARFNEIDSASLYAPVGEWLPSAPCRVLDVGAGTGRDATWFATLGHRVTAADPVPELRAAQSTDDFTWITSSLPDLEGVDGPFDLITLSGVWHHLPPDQRPAAMARLVALSASRARCLMSLREGPDSAANTAWPVPVPETCALANEAGFTVSGIVATVPQQSRNKQAGVRFTWLALTAPQG